MLAASCVEVFCAGDVIASLPACWAPAMVWARTLCFSGACCTVICAGTRAPPLLTHCCHSFLAHKPDGSFDDPACLHLFEMIYTSFKRNMGSGGALLEKYLGRYGSACPHLIPPLCSSSGVSLVLCAVLICIIASDCVDAVCTSRNLTMADQLANFVSFEVSPDAPLPLLQRMSSVYTLWVCRLVG